MSIIQKLPNHSLEISLPDTYILIEERW